MNNLAIKWFSGLKNSSLIIIAIGVSMLIINACMLYDVIKNENKAIKLFLLSSLLFVLSYFLVYLSAKYSLIDVIALMFLMLSIIAALINSGIELVNTMILIDDEEQ